MIMMLEMNHGVSHQQRQQQRAVEGGIEFEGVRNLGAHLHGTFAAGLPPACRWRSEEKRHLHARLLIRQSYNISSLTEGIIVFMKHNLRATRSQGCDSMVQATNTCRRTLTN